LNSTARGAAATLMLKAHIQATPRKTRRDRQAAAFN
jgi:hypothetical protein